MAVQVRPKKKKQLAISITNPPLPFPFARFIDDFDCAIKVNYPKQNRALRLNGFSTRFPMAIHQPTPLVRRLPLGLGLPLPKSRLGAQIRCLIWPKMFNYRKGALISPPVGSPTWSVLGAPFPTELAKCPLSECTVDSDNDDDDDGDEDGVGGTPSRERYILGTWGKRDRGSEQLKTWKRGSSSTPKLGML